MRKPAILIIDDLAVCRTMAYDVFKDEYEIYQAETGERGIAFLESGKRVDVILLDLVMPGMDGFDVLEYLKTKAEFINIPVLINTSAGEEKNVLRALELGAIDFITKPYNPVIVKRKVGNVLNKILDEREKLEDSLKEKNIQLQSISDNIPGAITVYRIGEKDIRTMYFNDGASEMLGYGRDEYAETVGENALQIIHPDDIEEFNRRVEHTLRTKTPMDFTVRVRHKDGSYRYVHLVASPYWKGDVPFANAVLIDVTNEVKANAEIAEAARRLRYQSRHDRLTGIYNHRTFYSETEKLFELNPKRKFGIVYIDIDQFKIINDLFGMDYADQILKKMAREMLAFIEKVGVGTCCRISSDQFAFCVPEEFIQPEKFTRQTMVTNEKISFPCRIGYSYGIYYVNDLSLTIMQMCDRAALAMNTIKGNANRHYAIYDEPLREKLIEEQEIISEMRTALRNNEFKVYLQPIYSASTNKIDSAEALVRWIHPQKGIIPPDKFIPVFEKNGFVVDVDKFMRQKVLELIIIRSQQHKKMVPVSVNISRVNFYNENFCADLIRDLNDLKVDHDMIKFEITESAYTDNPEQLLSVTEQLQREHLKILMDDFGSGYSSLNMLKEIPVDILKIDMRFLQDLETSSKAANIVSTVIELAGKLDMETVAEGVETRGQSDFLKKCGCDKMQGYYYSRPIPVKEFLKMLDEEVDEYENK